jgi:hypothetical protein
MKPPRSLQPRPVPRLELPPGRDLSGTIHFTAGVIKCFRQRGFITTADPTFDDVVAANFAMLTAAWLAGVRAPPPEAEAEAEAEAPTSPPAEASAPTPQPPPAPVEARRPSPPPPQADEDPDAHRRRVLEKMARATS